MKCHIPVDISKIKIKTKHFLGVKDKPSRCGVAAEICDEKGFSRGCCGSWRACLCEYPSGVTQGQAKV